MQAGLFYLVGKGGLFKKMEPDGGRLQFEVRKGMCFTTGKLLSFPVCKTKMLIYQPLLGVTMRYETKVYKMLSKKCRKIAKKSHRVFCFFSLH